jgi:hypothetical protein
MLLRIVDIELCQIFLNLSSETNLEISGRFAKQLPHIIGD